MISTLFQIKIMKLRILYTIFSLTLLTIISLSNSGGRATTANQGNTGAPGDEMQGNNTRTCQNCHATGDIQVLMSLDILDTENNPVTAYIPNEMYTVRVSIDSAAGPAANGYGFQMVNLFDADNSDVNGWMESGHSDNVQIAAATNTNRVYAEHRGVSEVNEFFVRWQAPEIGGGGVSFYAAGIGANLNGTTSGDGAVIPLQVTLTEGIVSAVVDLSRVGIGIEVAPNPVKDQLSLIIQSEQQSVVNVQLINATGQVFYHEQLNLQQGEQWEQIEMRELVKGVYFLQTTSGNAVNTQKIIKL